MRRVIICILISTKDYVPSIISADAVADAVADATDELIINSEISN